MSKDEKGEGFGSKTKTNFLYIESDSQNPIERKKVPMDKPKKRSLLKSLLIGLVSVLSLSGLLFIASLVRIYHFYNSPTNVDRYSISTIRPRAVDDLNTPQELYLDLMKIVLTRYQLEDHFVMLTKPEESRIDAFISSYFYITKPWNRLPLYRRMPFDPNLREHGRDWSRNAETMIGLKRLDNLQYCVTDVLRRNVSGDFIECGAWRGGACIFMRAALKAYGDFSRKVWVADSFEGLPKPEVRSEDAKYWEGGEMAVSVEQVQSNFTRYGLLDNQVVFLKGFFIDTLPKAKIERLAILRVDCDLYDSVTQSLEYLYDKVSVGGYVIIDDYGALPPAKNAVDDYRKAHGINTELIRIDWTGVYWQKER
jgi:O-methyltransferase